MNGVIQKRNAIVHNIFIKNPMWLVVTSCYWWSRKIILVLVSNYYQ